MRPAAKLTLIFLFAISLPVRQSFAQDAVSIAEEEAVRRQERTIQLHMTLQQAEAAQKRGQLEDAGKLYMKAVSDIPFVQVGNPTVDQEKKQALAGFDSVSEKLARHDMDQGDMTGALARIDAALIVDPNNESLRRLKIEINKRTVQMQGTVPSPDYVKMIPEIKKEKMDVATQVQNAKLLYEMGKYDQAEDILNKILKEDPSNKTAPYYLDLVKEARFAANSRKEEAQAKTSIASVEKAWIPSTKGESLPIPNPMATTNLIYTSPGRQEIRSKLEHMRMGDVQYDLPLNEVLNKLRIETQKRDPDGIGINFMWNPHPDAAPTGVSPTDQTGAAAAGAVALPAQLPPVDITTINIKISPPLSNLRLIDVLDAITKSSDPTAIKFSIEDYAVVFSPKAPEVAALYTKVFKVDPNTFVQGLQNVSGFNLNQNLGGTGTIGGGSTGGTGSTGGSGNSQTTSPAVLPEVSFAPITTGTTGTGGVGAGAGGNQVGLEYVTKTNYTKAAGLLVQDYFKAAGVDLSPPKNVFFNDRLGELMVRATLSDLEIIEQAIELLNQAPPEVSIEAKFVELSQEDSRALGFNWYMGNTLINNGAIGAQGGTAPSYQGPSTAANPSGIFPGPGTLNSDGVTYTPGPGAISPSASDNNLTSGLINQYTFQGATGQIPTVATITGIMTDPQFRVAINAIQNRAGSDLLYAPKVTTLSGRQTHISAQDLQTIVVNASVGTSTSPTGGLVGGVGAVVPTINYSTEAFPFGPALDVMPTVSADGFSIQMVILPTVLEFIGYDSPGAFVPESVAASGGTLGVPITAQLPLPHFRIREVVTTCNVWDGQTVVLGGMISETITKLKSEIPVLGDLPLVGRLFQNESTDSVKQNLLIFVTPTIIDPAGNRVHNDEDMPFARNSIPPQPAAQ